MTEQIQYYCIMKSKIFFSISLVYFVYTSEDADFPGEFSVISHRLMLLSFHLVELCHFHLLFLNFHHVLEVE